MSDRGLKCAASDSTAAAITEESPLRNICEPGELKGVDHDTPATFDGFHGFKELGFIWDGCFFGDQSFPTLSEFELLDLLDIGA